MRDDAGVAEREDKVLAAVSTGGDTCPDGSCISRSRGALRARRRLTGSDVPLRSLAARFLACVTATISPVDAHLDGNAEERTLMTTTLRLRPLPASAAAGPAWSFLLERIGLWLLELQLDVDDESRRFGTILMAQERSRSWGGRELPPSCGTTRWGEELRCCCGG